MTIAFLFLTFDIFPRETVIKDNNDYFLLFRTQLKLETLDDAVVLADPEDDLLGDKHGCPAYVSPEILATVNGRYSGRAADCWSLGVILYTMLVGRYPFHDTDPSLLFGKIRRGFFQVPSTLSPLAKCLIKSLLRKDPEERLTAEDLLASNWFELMSSPNTYYHKHHTAYCASLPSSTNTATAGLVDITSLLQTASSSPSPTHFTSSSSEPASSTSRTSDRQATIFAANNSVSGSIQTTPPSLMPSIFITQPMVINASANNLSNTSLNDASDRVVPCL